jgi:hypothetical protein
MRYALLIYQDEAVEISADDRAARFASYASFIGDLDSRGVLQAFARLQPTRTATTVRMRQGDLVIADGPFAETKEQIGGVFVVECADLDEAIAIAAGIPTADQDTIEVRPVWQM